MPTRLTNWIGSVVSALSGVSVANDDKFLIVDSSDGVTKSIRADEMDAVPALVAAFQALDADLTDLAGKWARATASGPASLDFSEDTDNGSHRVRVIAPASIASDKTITLPDITGTVYVTGSEFPTVIAVACSDETTAITTGPNKTKFRMPHAMTLTAVRASLTTAASSGTFTVDIHESGTTVLSTKLTFDSGEKTTTTAGAAAVISDSALADDAEISIDVDDDAAGDATGLKVYLIGTRSV